MSMSNDFEERRIIAHGPSTRVVRLTTGDRVRFAPEALHDMVRQTREGFVAMNIEHLNLLPPAGRWTDGEVKTLEDGEQQVLLYGEMLDQFVASAEIDDPFLPDVDAGPGPAVVEVSLGVEARNFDPETLKDAVAECPLPVKELQKWSSLPPIEWVVTIPVAWGAAKFLGSFLERLGVAASDALVNWLKATSRKAREPERDRYVTLSFDLEDGRQVFGFVPFGAHEDDLAAVTAALDSAGTLAEVAGLLNDDAQPATHRVAYLFDSGEWKLAWFVTNDGAYCTKYFSDNMPDPERFLGRSLLSEIPTSEPPSQKNDGGG